MNITELLRERHFRRRLFPVEMVTLSYAALTLLMILIFWGRMSNPLWLVSQRLLVAGAVVCVYAFNKMRPCAVTRFLRHLLPLCLLGFWYPDTYEFSRLWPNLDHVFAQTDLTLFNFQPALTFAWEFPQPFVRELMNLGYFSYYPMIAVGAFLPLVKGRKLFEKSVFIIIASFFLFYIIYLFLPVAGPQFYFPAIGVDNALQGNFLPVGDYFTHHAELPPSVARDGFFGSLVSFIQQGERPTAAFPSSHVGVATILMIQFVRHHRRAAIIFAPFYLLLCVSTVYIRAHYLIDVFGGLACGVIFYVLVRAAYKPLKGKSSHQRSSHHHHHHHTQTHTQTNDLNQ